VKNKIVYIDLDDVLADFYSATADPKTFRVQERLMWDKDFFFNLKPIPGAQGSVFEIQKLGYDVWILSQPLADNFESYSDKARWVQVHFPALYKKIVLTQDKSLNRGDFLIDDNDKKWKEKFEQNGGKFIHFNYGGYNQSWAANTTKLWMDVVDFLRSQNPYVE
jgi:5'-nucleotidase